MECSGASKPDRTSLGSGAKSRSTVSERRRNRVGGVGAVAYAPGLRTMPAVYGKQCRGTGSDAGSVRARVSHAKELSLRGRFVWHMAGARDAEPVDRSLPAHAPGARDGLD